MDDPKSRLFRSGEGTTYLLDRLTLTFKHDGREACGYSVCIATSEPGWPGARLHRHGYEEWHIQVEGESECRLGDEVRRLGPGDMAYIPSGAPHGVNSTGSGARQLLISSPPGLFEGFVKEVVAYQNGPPAPDARQEVARIAAMYGIEFLD
jgi:mannose-6-phosphate isomerase-like protein (cupin superfamily)